jgi:hypothetical protein
MAARNWYSADETRESWLFLLLDVEQRSENPTPNLDESTAGASYICSWEIGIGNAVGLSESHAARIGIGKTTTETELLEELYSRLNPYRYLDVVLITPSTETLQFLRRRLVCNSGIDKPSLRGFYHAEFENILEQYFGQTLEDFELNEFARSRPSEAYGNSAKAAASGSIEDFWRMWARVFSLFPPDELRGAPL